MVLHKTLNLDFINFAIFLSYYVVNPFKPSYVYYYHTFDIFWKLYINKYINVYFLIILFITNIAIFMPVFYNFVNKLVGMAGFEPTTTTPPV
jgi:hypothetical protein